MGTLHTSALVDGSLPASLGAVLTLAALSTASTPVNLDFPAITVDSLASVFVEPLPIGLRFPLLLTSNPMRWATPLEVLQEGGQSGIIYAAQPKRRRKGRKSMSRRSGQNITVVIQAGWYRVRWRQDVEGQEQRQQMNEKITPVVLDKKGNPKPPSPEVRRMAREIVERSGANSKEHFDHVVLGVETFKERAEAWLREVQRRRYDKYKASTLPTIEGALRKHIYPVIGHLPLAQVNNKSCKPLVEAMFNAELSICSVNNYMRLVLQLVHSVKDPETGEPIHRLKWNREYLGLPKILKDEQHVPAVTVGQVDKLVSESKSDEQALYVIAAASGMRIAEILGLEARHIVNNGRTLVVEQSVNRFGRLRG